MQDTARKLASGTAWTTAGEAVTSVAALLGTVIAARLVPPSEFGRMGIVILVLACIEAFTQSGFEQALVQREEGVEALLDVAWTWTLVRGLCIAAGMCAAAPALAALYGDPSLVPILCVSALGPALRGGMNVGVVLYRRQLDFRSVFAIGIAAPLVRFAVAVTAAFAWRNVWSLVIAAVAEALAQLVASFAGHAYRPRLRWSWREFRSLVRFGRWITVASILNFCVVRGDDLFVSKMLGYTALGFYQLAFQIANFPATNITHVVSRVSFPAYAQLQGDGPQLRSAFVQVMRATMLVALPVGTFLFVCAPVVPVVLGDRWAPVVPLLQLLVIGGTIRAFLAVGGTLFLGTGRPDLDVAMQIPRFLVLAGTLYPFSALWGLPGVCVASLASVTVCLPTWFHGVLRQVGLGPLAVLRANALAIVSSLTLGVVLAAVAPVAAHGKIGVVASALAGPVVWLLVMRVLDAVTPFRLFDEFRRLRAALRP